MHVIGFVIAPTFKDTLCKSGLQFDTNEYITIRDKYALVPGCDNGLKSIMCVQQSGYCQTFFVTDKWYW